MGGSRKGEHRGNARKRTWRPKQSPEAAKQKRRLKDREQHRTHERAADVMNEQVRKRGNAKLEHAVIERRITVARIINGPTDDVDDIMPKEMMLMGMRHAARAINDYKAMLDQVSRLPITPETIAQTQALDAEIERQYQVAGEFARNAAGYFHPKQQTIGVANLGGVNEATILGQLLTEIDEVERARPIPIEHKINKGGGI